MGREPPQAVQKGRVDRWAFAPVWPTILIAGLSVSGEYVVDTPGRLLTGWNSQRLRIEAAQSHRSTVASGIANIDNHKVGVVIDAR